MPEADKPIGIPPEEGKPKKIEIQPEKVVEMFKEKPELLKVAREMSEMLEIDPIGGELGIKAGKNIDEINDLLYGTGKAMQRLKSQFPDGTFIDIKNKGQDKEILILALKALKEHEKKVEVEVGKIAVEPVGAKLEENEDKEDSEVEMMGKDELFQKLEIVLKKVPKADDPTRDQKLEDVRTAKRKLINEGFDVDKYIGKVGGKTTLTDEEKRQRGIKKSDLRAAVAAAKKGRVDQRQAEMLEIIGLKLDELGVEIEVGRAMNARPGNDSTQQMESYLESILRMPPGMQRDNLLGGWLNQNGSIADQPLIEKAMSGLRVPDARRAEVPTGEKEFRSFIRQKIRNVIRLANSDDQLSLKAIEDSLILDMTREMGIDPSKGYLIELFPSNIRGNLAEIRLQVENEIRARANLRRLQIQEERYKSYQDRGAALSRYVSDMKGTEGNPASPSIIARETYSWLKNLENLGDPEGATTEKVDKVFAILLLLGESNPEFSEPWMSGFEGFRRVGDPNLYDPAYNINRKNEAMVLLADRFGEDSRDLALQLFQAYKEEGNYNWQHYLSSLFKFANSRSALANLTPPVYSGSRRVYMEGEQETGHSSYRDEIKYLAVSPLKVPGKVGERRAPTHDDPNRVEEIKENGLYFRRAIKGKFLQETELVDPKFVKNNPEVDAFTIIKSAEKIKTAISNIGTLGDEADKNQAISKAQTYLADLRANAQAIVALNGILDQDEVDRQIYFEARNVLWELSILNPVNVRDLSRQTREKPKFLLPSGLSELMMSFGSRAGNTEYGIVSNQAYYSDLRDRVQKIREDTLRLIEKGPDEKGMVYGDNDQKIIERETNNYKGVELPKNPGEALIRKTTDVSLKVAESITFPAEVVRKSVLSRIPGPIGKYFKGRRVF